MLAPAKGASFPHNKSRATSGGWHEEFGIVMADAHKEIRLNAFHMCSPSQSWAGMWTHPTDRCLGYTDIDYYIQLAQLAERGLLDSIFFADSIGLMDRYGGGPGEALRAGAMAPMNDPTLAISAMAHATQHLGFGVTANLTYEHPFILARRFSTLDHLTKGRIGWNIVAGFVESGARATGREAIRDHDERYDMADEYMEVVHKLWEESWEEGPCCATPRSVFMPIPPGCIPSPMRARTIAWRPCICANPRPSARRCFFRRALRRGAGVSPLAMRNACS